jgi:hypothetical protein
MFVSCLKLIFSNQLVIIKQMFTNFARAAVWGSSWFFNPEIETNPLMSVTLDLAAVDPQTLNMCPFRMDRQIFKGIVWGITEQQKLTDLQ